MSSSYVIYDILEPSAYFEAPKDNSLPASNAEKMNHIAEILNEDAVKEENVKPQTHAEKQSLPESIKIIETILMGVSHYGVFCSEKVIKKGTRFGPFTGRNIAPGDIFTLSDTSYTWEVSALV